MPAGMRSAFVRGAALLLVLGVVSALATRLAIDTLEVLAWGLVSLLVGVAVGFSEVLSRYRSAPLLAATTPAGAMYLALNGLISLGAFALIRRYPDKFPGLTADLLLLTVVAGFGAMTVLRSKLFTFRASDGTEYEIGPAIVVDRMLKALDGKIDQRRAAARRAKVSKAMADLRDFDNTAKYFEFSLLSFQHLTQDEKAAVALVIQDFRKVEWPDPLKIQAMGLALLEVVGEDNFEQVVSNIRDYLRNLPL
jgi:hypothetical protein